MIGQDGNDNGLIEGSQQTLTISPSTERILMWVPSISLLSKRLREWRS